MLCKALLSLLPPSTLLHTCLYHLVPCTPLESGCVAGPHCPALLLGSDFLRVWWPMVVEQQGWGPRPSPWGPERITIFLWLHERNVYALYLQGDRYGF